MSSRSAKILALAISTSSLTEVSKGNSERNISNGAALKRELFESVGPHTFDDIPIVFEDINLIDNSLSEYIVIDDPSMRSKNIQIEQSAFEELLPAQVKWRTL